jgi:SAM-dependent methyltransferase
MMLAGSDASTMTWEAAVETLRRDPAQRELVQACFYDDPLSEAADRYWRSSEWAAIRPLLPTPPGAALDIGAGRGIAAYAFARDGWRATALEPDPSAIVGAGAIRALAAETGQAIEVVEEWGESLPFDTARFDAVHCRAVLHHARDLPALCREVARVLKPGGRFIATREHVVSRHEDIPAFQAAHPLHALYGGEYAYRVDEYLSAIRDAGMAVDQVLNPLESDINVFPTTTEEIKRNWARKLHLPIAPLIPDAALRWRGARQDAPGRLYTFVARKTAAR